MRLAIILSGILVITGAFVAQAEILDYSEDFSSSQYRDQALTTAVWDTVVGAVYLAPLGLSPLGSYDTSGNSYATVLDDGYIFLADGYGGLHSFPADTPSAISPANFMATIEQVRGIDVQGDYAFLAVGSSGLQSFNISDPLDMLPGGSADPTGSGFASGVAVAGSYAYLANSAEGIAVIGISSPANPSYTTSVATSDYARSVTVHNGSLLVADGSAGLTVMSLANPALPNAIGALFTGGNCRSIAADGDLVYLADGTNGLVIADFSDPSDPIQIGHLDTAADASFTGTCRHVAAAGDTLFVASGTGGIYLVDITDPTDPTVVGHRDTDGEAYQVTLVGTVSWLSDGPEGLLTFEADPTILDTANNRAQSLDFSGSGEPISRAKLNASYTDSILFEMTCNGGTNWEEVYSGDDWHEFQAEGADLRWRMTLTQDSPEQNPRCDNLTITFERQHSYGEIITITDVPADEGGRIRVLFSASRFDAPGQEETITEYSLYRRYDGTQAVAADQEKLYPPGSWDFIGTIPADEEAEYATVVPTLIDSSVTGNNYTAIFVRARTTTIGLFYDSPVDSGYSVNNSQPAPPTNFQVNDAPVEGYQLTWDSSPDPEFAHFRIYRATSPTILPQPATLYQVTVGVSFFDTTQESWYYHLTVVNTAGHESEPVAGSSVSAVPDALISILQSSPNPFNPSTRIEFSVPAGGQKTRLEIYDFRGRLVRSLHDGFLGEGIHQHTWDGTDSRGQGVASGIYTCLLKSSTVDRKIKVTLVR